MDYLTKKTKIGYGAGSFFESGFYNYVTTFYLIYLTTVIHISPETAGLICSISVLMEAVGGVWAGHVSDQFYTSYGRRRPFMLVAGLAGCIFICFMFFPVNLNGSSLIVYYFIVTTLFWGAYSFFYIPYISLAAEMTSDYNERVTIRSYCRIFGIFGNLICTVCPLWFVTLLINQGFQTTTAWTFFAVIMACLSAVSCFISWKSSKGLEPVYGENDIKPDKRPIYGLLHDYWQIIRLKCLAILLSARTFFIIAYAFYTASLVYFMKYKIGLSDSVTSTVFLIGIVSSFLYTPLIEMITKNISKQTTIIVAFIIAGLNGIIFTVINVESMYAVFIYICIFTFAHSCFWQINNSMFYDVTEVDEYKYGKRREGSITSLMSMLGTCAVSLGLYLVGALLKLSGFDGTLSVQSESAIEMIGNIFVLFPCIMLLCAGVILIFYPMNKDRFEALKKAIELKKQGKDIGNLKNQIKKLY